MIDQYLSHELQRLDVLLHREILRLRARYHLSLDEFRGLYVSDEQVDSLVRNMPGTPEILDNLPRSCDEPPEWKLLDFTPFEHDILLLALARELNLKYETIYAYLQNDVARKKPSVELALRVCSNPDRNAFLPEGRLFQTGLLDASGDGFLGRELTLPLAVLRRLTGLAPESAVPAATTAHDDVVTASATLARLYLIEADDPFDARSAIETACHAAQRRLLTLNLAAPDQAARIRLLQKLKPAACASSSPRTCSRRPRLVVSSTTSRTLPRPSGLCYLPKHIGEALSLPTLFEPSASPNPRTTNAFSSGRPMRRMRRQLNSRPATPSARSALHRLLLHAQDMLALANEARAPDLTDLASAIRSQSESTIGRFARRVVTNQTWDDLVLPASTLRQVRELAEAIRHRHTVYDAWGFGQKHSGIED